MLTGILRGRVFKPVAQAMATQTAGIKRPITAGILDVAPSKRPHCSYGDNCYRRNPIHLSEYHHPHLDKLLTEQSSSDLKVPDTYNAKVEKELIIDQLKVLEKIYARFPNDAPKKKADLEPPKKKPNLQSEAPKNMPSLQSETPKRKANSPAIPSRSKNTKTSFQNNDVPKASQATSSQSSSRTSKSPSPAPSSSASSSSISISEPVRGLSQGEFRSMKKKVKASLKEDLKQSSPFSTDMPTRIAAAAPYNFFLTKVRAEPRTFHEQYSITFRELLTPSLGKLRTSLQINFLVDLPWVMHHYEHHGLDKKPLLIIHGEENDDLKQENLPKNIKAVRIKTPHPFGHHHTKMSMMHYEDGGLRVVVSTANLVPSDWHNRTQGVWVSPVCPELPEDADTKAGDSPTEFKTDLLRYIIAYKVPQLQEWVAIIRRTDFSDIRVCFVGSVPGTHQGPSAEHFGHRRLGYFLKKHAVGVDSSWPVVGQCSSIGSLGPQPDSWVLNELRASMSFGKGASILQRPSSFKVVYPSKQNVLDSFDGALGGDCLPYSMQTHNKQTWLNNFLFQWKSDGRHRTRAVPHIKTYTRMSPCGGHLAWFHLTSANLSKAAWGMQKKTKNSGGGIFMMSYEAGVLFLPQMLINKPYFHLDSENDDTWPPFPMPYDTPPTKYKADDKAWVMEYLNQYLKTQRK